MSPILGIWASGQQPALATSFESIATVTVGSGGSSSITFSSIPSTYKHLQIRYIGKNAQSGNTGWNLLRFNSDSTTGNYVQIHSISGDGSSASAYYDASVAYVYGGRTTGTTPTAMGVGIIDILDYTSTNKNKTIRVLSGYDNNGSGDVVFSSGLWYPSSIAAINNITIYPSTANYSQYSSFALYGIKGA